MWLITVLYTILASFMIVILFLMTYISFVIFFCCSIQTVISFFISYAVLGLIDNKLLLMKSILWILFSIPLVHLLLGINFKIIFSYFKNIWNVLSFEGIKNTIRSDFERSKCNKACKVIEYIFLLIGYIGLGALIVNEIFTPGENANISATIGIISVIPLISGFFKVLWRSMKSLFMNPPINLNNYNQTDPIDQSLIEEPSEVSGTNNANDNKRKNKNEVKQSLYDPCGIIDQVDYFNFIEDPEVNYFASFFKIRKCKVQMIPAFIIFLIVIAYIIFDGYLLFHNYNGTNPIPFVIRSIIYILGIPFLMIFNFSVLFMNFKKMKEKHSFIQKMMIVVSAAYLLFIIAGMVFIFVTRSKFSTYIPDKIVYRNTTKKVKFSEPASICETEYYGLNLIQYAGLAAISQSSNQELTAEIIKYLFNNNEKEFHNYNNHMYNIYEVKINNQLTVISINPLINIYGVAFILENYFNDFIPNKLFGGVIPFYDIAYELLLSRFMNLISSRLTAIVGVPQITNDYSYNNKVTHDFFSSKINNKIVYTGHSIGGLLAKGLGSTFHVPSVAIESLNYYHSLFSAAMSTLSREINFITNGFQMINVYSPTQLFAQFESNSTMNIELPQWKGSLQYINPYDATCLIAAGCADDESYDGLCDQTIGLEKYKYLFTLWNRTRSDMI